MGALDCKLIKPKWYLETFTEIKTKTGGMVPFIFKDVQNQYYETLVDDQGHLRRGLRDIIFKSRQHGFTTQSMGIFLHDTITNEGINTLIILQDWDKAKEKLQDLKHMFYSIPEEERPKTEYDTKYELTFPELKSSIRIATAKENVGRSQTYHNILCSETAFWKCNENEAMAGLLETCPDDFGNLIVESTPSGMGNWFYDNVMKCRRKDSIFDLHEFGWWLDPDNVKEPLDKPFDGQEEPLLSDEEKRLRKKHNLSYGQIRWRRYKIRALGKRMFLQEHELSFLQSGANVFDSSYLQLYAPNQAPIEDYSLGVYIYQEPVEGRNYVIGADTAEGIKDGDYQSATVLDLETGIEVASLHYKWSRDEYARKLDWIGRKYNNAVIGVERQNHGHDILGRLNDGRGNPDDIPYPNLYWHRDYDATGQSFKLGYPTTSKTKPIMINELEEALRKGFILLASQSIIDELQIYEYKDNGKMGAPEGYHDDRVMSTAIAWQLRKSPQSFSDGDDNEAGVSVRSA